MLTNAYSVGGRVGLKLKNAYGCLRYVWVGGLENFGVEWVGLTKTFAYVICEWPLGGGIGTLKIGCGIQIL